MNIDSQHHSSESFNLKKTSYFFWGFILIHTLLWTIGPTFLRPTVPHDTLESITWGFQWQLGYNKHPFLAAWLCAAITQLFSSVGWPVYLLAQLAVSTTLIAVWKLAKQILPLRHAYIAALALEGVLFYNINSFNFTPDTLQSPLWALLSLFFYQALNKQNISNWLYTAFFAALCVCTKYQAGLLLLPMILFCLFNSWGHKSFTKPGIYCALMAFFIFLTPHFIWLAHHHFITLTYAAEIAGDYTPNKSLLNHIIHPLGFLINCMSNVLGLFILLWPFFNKEKIRLTLDPFKWQFLICIGLGPFVLSLIICMFTGDYFPPRWATPYFFTLGILVLACLKPELSSKKMKQFAITLILFSSLLFISRMSTLTLFPRPGSDAFLPNKNIAASITKIWRDQYHKPLPFLAGSHYLVTGLVPYMSDRPIPFLSWDPEDSSWIDENEVKRQGGIFIWDESGYYTWDAISRSNTHIPKSVLEHYPNLKILPDFIFYRLSDGQAIVIGAAILPPQ